MPRLLAFLVALAPSALMAGNLKPSTEGWKLRYSLAAMFERRYAPPASEFHLKNASSASQKDSCTFVAGVRHCPLPKLPQ